MPPSELRDRELHVSASIGIAAGTGDAETLLRDADLAMYRAKSRGKGRYAVYEPGMHTAIVERLELEVDLKRGLEQGELTVAYQPIFSLVSGTVTGVEALVRWQHPTRGVVMPESFVPMAEESGLILQLGEWVLRRACEQAMQWPDLLMSVNLSPVQFRHRDLVGMVRRVLAETGMDPGRLELEITEGVLLYDTETALRVLRALRDLGVRIAMDDFGTGYSSLSYLHSFPLDKVKIDRSFMRGIATGGRPLTLLRGVARLTTELGMSVTVEGIETSEELTMVTRERSIDEAQGYLFSPAIPATAIRALLAAAVAPLAVRHLAPVGKAAKVRVA